MKFQTFLNKVKIEEELKNNGDCFMLNEYQKELFKINIDEKVSPNLPKKIMDAAYKQLMKRFDIEKEDLEYIGFSDLSFLKAGSKLLQFNIIKKGHRSFGSTVAFKYEG